MNVVQVIGAFMAGLIGIAALSLIVKPGNTTGQVIGAFGDAIAKDIGAAKQQ